MSDSSFLSCLIDSCDISRRTLSGTPDEWGSTPESFTSVATGVPSLFQQMDEDIEFDRRGKKLKTRMCVFFSISADVKEDDVLIFDGQRYEVIAVDNAAGISHHLEVYVRNMENT